LFYKLSTFCTTNAKVTGYQEAVGFNVNSMTLSVMKHKFSSLLTSFGKVISFPLFIFSTM